MTTEPADQPDAIFTNQGSTVPHCIPFSNSRYVSQACHDAALYCDSKASPPLHYAGRFAAKEAIKKCILSTGKVDQIGFNEIEILPGKNGEPIVSLIEKLSYIKLEVSISHEKEYAIAMALIII